MCVMSLTLKIVLIAIAAATAQSTLAALPIEHWTATTGARVYFVSDPSVPMLDTNLDVDAGSRYEPAVKMGLASLTTGMPDKGVAVQGNTPARDEAATANAFADVGASFGDGAGGNCAGLRLHTLSGPVERGPATAPMTRIISVSTFPDVVLARDRQHLMAVIRESLTKPSVFIERASGKAIYGTHPYGRTIAPETVENVTRDDIMHYYQTDYTAKHAVMMLIDAISRQEAEAITEQITCGLPANGATSPALPNARVPLIKAETIRIPHPAQQATIILRQPGVMHGDKDYSPLPVGSYVLGGGGFSTRLTNKMHEKHSLAYSIGSYFAPAVQPGPFELAPQTHRDQTEETLGVMCDTVTRFVADSPTDVELKTAKDNLVDGFPLRLSSNRKLLDSVANIGWYNLSLDYLSTWTQRTAAITRDQVHTVFQHALQPQTVATIVVGGPEKAAAN